MCQWVTPAGTGITVGRVSGPATSLYGPHVEVKSTKRPSGVQRYQRMPPALTTALTVCTTLLADESEERLLELLVSERLLALLLLLGDERLLGLLELLEEDEEADEAEEGLE